MSTERVKFSVSTRLSEEEFKKFLSIARKLAVYDPREKVWVFDAEKAVSNLGSEVLSVARAGIDFEEAVLDKLLDVIHELKRYVVLAPDDIEAMYDSVEEFLRKPAVTIWRDEGLLKILFRDSAVLRAMYNDVVDAASVTYYVEKPKREGDRVVGVEFVPKTLKLIRRREKRLYEAPVGLLAYIEDAVKRRCRELGQTYTVSIPVRSRLSIEMEKRFELYEHQKIAYRNWVENGMRGTIAIFTRGGKSFVAMQAIYDLKVPTIIFVTTRELMHTWVEYLDKYLGIPRDKVGLLGDGLYEVRDITVATYKSAVSYIDKISQRFEFAVFDEGHHVPARTFSKVAIRIDAQFRMALTATPRRRDMNHTLLMKLCGPQVARFTYTELVNMKVVAPIEVFETIYVKGQEEKLNVLVDLLRKHENEKTIVFTQYIDTVNKISKRLFREGIKHAVITGETPQQKRDRAFKDFVEGRVKVIVTTKVLDEGITVPDAEVAIIYEGSGEPRQMIQRIGRVLGYAPGKTAKIYEIVDTTNPSEVRAHKKRAEVKKYYIYMSDASSLSESMLRSSRAE